MRLTIWFLILFSALAAWPPISLAQTKPVPFASVDPNASQPIASTEKARAVLQFEIFKNPGLYDPVWIQLHKNALRTAGRNSDADALALLAALRRSIYNAICRQPYTYYGSRVRNPYEAAIADLIHWQKAGRTSINLKAALETALRLDATAPFSYRPSTDWCPEAFVLVPKMSANGEPQTAKGSRGLPIGVWQSVKLRDPVAFEAEQLKQREWLQSTVLAVVSAAQVSASNKLPSFTTGEPGSAGTATTKAFLRLFKPTVTLVPQNGEFAAIGQFGSISADGSAIMYASPDEGVWFYARLADQKRVPISDHQRFIAGPNRPVFMAKGNVPTFVQIDFASCGMKTPWASEPCALQLKATLRGLNSKGETRLSMPVHGLDQKMVWSVEDADYDRNSRMALVRASGYSGKSAKAIAQGVVQRPGPLSRAMIAVDLSKGSILGTFSDKTVPELFGGDFTGFGSALAMNQKGQPVLASINLYKPGAEGFRLNLVDGSKETKSLQFPKSTGLASVAAEWFAKGYDYTAAADACERIALPRDEDRYGWFGSSGRLACSVVAQTPDKKYWLFRRHRSFEQGSLVVIGAQDLQRIGSFELGEFVQYVSQSASISPTVFLLRAGPITQAYQYQAQEK